MEKNSRLKPLRVKLSLPGLEYVMVLVQRDSFVINLKKEIQDTLKKLFPCKSYCQISNIRKDNGRILLPDWYPVDPLLKDDEEVVISYDSLNSDCSQCLEDELSYSRSAPRNLDNCRPQSHSNQKLHSEQNVNSALRPIDNDHGHDLLRDMNDISLVGINVTDVQNFVDGVFQNHDASNVRKRKGDERTSTSDLPEPTVALSESPFKKLKVELIDDVISSNSPEDPESQTFQGSVRNSDGISHLQLPVESNAPSPNDTLILTPKKAKNGNEADKNSTSPFDSREPVGKGISLNEADTPVVDKCTIPSNNLVNNSNNTISKPQELSKNDDDIILTNKKDEKKKKKRRRESKHESLREETQNYSVVDNSFSENKEIFSSKAHKKKRNKEKEYGTNDNAEKCSRETSGDNFACNGVEEFATIRTKDNQVEKGKDLVADEDKVEHTRKEKKKKKKEKDKEHKGHNASLETLFSSSSITASDVKESGIGSDSTVYDLEKRIRKLSGSKDTSEFSNLKSDEVSPVNRNGTGEFARQKKIRKEKDNSGFLESELDSTRISGDAPLKKEKKKSKKSEKKAKESNSKNIKEKSNEAIKEFKVPNTNVKKVHREDGDSEGVGGKVSSCRRGVPGDLEKSDETLVADAHDRFDSETDVEMGNIQSQIRKVMDDIVDESDYSQSLIKEPLMFLNKFSDNTLPQQKEGSKVCYEVVSKSVSKNKSKTESKHASKREKDSTNLAKSFAEDSKQVELESKREKTKKKTAKIISNKAGSKQSLKNGSVELFSDSDSSSLTFSDCEHSATEKKNEKRQDKKAPRAKDKCAKAEEKSKQVEKDATKQEGKQEEKQEVKQRGKQDEKQKDMQKKKQVEKQRDKQEEEQEEKQEGKQEMEKQEEKHKEKQAQKQKGAQEGKWEEKQEKKQLEKKEGKQEEDRETSMDKSDDEQTEKQKENTEGKLKSQSGKMQSEKQVLKSGKAGKLNKSRKENCSNENNPTDSGKVDNVEQIVSRNMQDKRRRRRKKSIDSSRKSVARVRDWLSQIADDVPTETELEIEKDKDSVDNETSAGKGKEKLPNLDTLQGRDRVTNDDVVDDTQKDLNISTLSAKSNIDKNDIEEGDDSDDAKVQPVAMKKSSVDKVTGKDADNSIRGASQSLEQSKKSRESPAKKNTKNQSKGLQKTPDEKNSRSEDEMTDLRFDALVEGGGSVVSPRVPRPKENNASYVQKTLTGFLSPEDQKRFQSKLKSNKSSPVNKIEPRVSLF